MRRLLRIAIITACASVAQAVCCPCGAYAGIKTSDLNSAEPGYSWKFSYVQLTDIHIGHGTTDYASPGYDDTLSGVTEGRPEKNLREAVEYINAHRGKLKIKFVVVTGDITHHAQRSEFLKAREILNGLSIPYVPVIGNHDVWPFSSGGEAAPSPIGGLYFREIFAQEFARLKTFFPEWQDAYVPPQSATATATGYLQNYAFRYDGYWFAAPDIIGRAHAPTVGSPVTVDLFKHEGGTWDWLSRYYSSSTAEKKHIVVLAHYPITSEDFKGERLFQREYEAIAGLLSSREAIGLWNSGHMHRNKQYRADYNGKNITSVIETGTNRKKTTLRVIRVWDK